MTTIDLNRIATFVHVVDAQSFTAAAAALGVPKSSVSRSIATLEQELGVRLLNRTTRKLHLTNAGRELYHRARGAVVGLDEAVVAVSDMSEQPRGLVRITAPIDLGGLLLPEVIARFVRQYPKIDVELSLSNRIVDLAGEGFDIALRAARSIDDASLVARKIAASMLGLFAAPSYLKRRAAPRTVAQIAEHECVLFRAREGRAVWVLSGPGGDESVEVRGTITADDLTFVRGAVTAGAGVGMLPLVFCTKGAQGEALVRLLPDYAVAGGSLYVVTSSVRYEPSRVTLLRRFLIEELRWIDGARRPARAARG